jgi:hypothetical protein
VTNTGEYAIAASRDRADTLFGWGFGGSSLRVSPDAGITWTTAFQPYPGTAYLMKTLAQGGTPPIVAVAGDGGEPLASHALHVSFDGGLSFAPRNPPPSPIRQLAIAPSSSATLYASTFPAVAADPNLWRSRNGRRRGSPLEPSRRRRRDHRSTTCMRSRSIRAIPIASTSVSRCRTASCAATTAARRGRARPRVSAQAR